MLAIPLYGGYNNCGFCGRGVHPLSARRGIKEKWWWFDVYDPILGGVPARRKKRSVINEPPSPPSFSLFTLALRQE
jgi:hypothetical protein